MSLSNDNVILWIPKIMKEVINTNQAHEFSVYTEFNFFWKFKDFNIYKATISDQMHMFKSWNYKYFIKFTCTYLQQKVNNKAVKEMDHKLCAIPRHSGLISILNWKEQKI